MEPEANIFNALLSLQAAGSDYLQQTGTELMDYIEIDWSCPQRVYLRDKAIPALFRAAIREHLGQFIKDKL